MNELLIVFLYKSLKDLKPSNAFNTTIGKSFATSIFKVNVYII